MKGQHAEFMLAHSLLRLENGALDQHSTKVQLLLLQIGRAVRLRQISQNLCGPFIDFLVHFAHGYPKNCTRYLCSGSRELHEIAVLSCFRGR